MSERSEYLVTAIQLYLDLPGAPRRAARSDWAIAATLYDRGVTLETLAHVLRLATLRRAQPLSPLEPIHSLAYYRQVLDHLTPEALDPGYVDYVARTYQALFGDSAARPNQTRAF